MIVYYIDNDFALHYAVRHIVVEVLSKTKPLTLSFFKIVSEEKINYLLRLLININMFF